MRCVSWRRLICSAVGYASFGYAISWALAILLFVFAPLNRLGDPPSKQWPIPPQRQSWGTPFAADAFVGFGRSEYNWHGVSDIGGVRVRVVESGWPLRTFRSTTYEDPSWLPTGGQIQIRSPSALAHGLAVPSILLPLLPERFRVAPQEERIPILPTLGCVASTLTLGAISMAIAHVWRWGAAFRRRRGARCEKCGYAVAGLARCPECGHPPIQ